MSHEDTSQGSGEGDDGDLGGLGPLVPAPTTLPAPLGLGPRAVEIPLMRVRTAGGDTTINVSMEGLLVTRDQLRAADSVGQEQLGHVLGASWQAMSETHALPLSWRIPGFGVRMAALSGRLSGHCAVLAAGATAVQSAHDGYRDAENVAQRLISLAVTAGEAPLMLNNAMMPGGEHGAVGNWARSAGVQGVFAFFDVTGARKGLPSGRSGASSPVSGLLGLRDVIEGAVHASQYLLWSHDQSLERTGSGFSHRGDSTMSGYFAEMQQVSEAGDLAVSVITADDGSQTYMVHLAGLDLSMEDGELDLSAGRGVLGLTDTIAGDSASMGEMVDQALQDAGAQPGDTIALSGYSMGGIQATNLAANAQLQSRYNLAAVATIGAAGQHRELPRNTSVTHLQDGRDPVSHLYGEHHQSSSERLTITYDHHRPGAETQGILGSAHAYEHHLSAMETLEDPSQDLLTQEERAHMAEFSDLYDGDVETFVYSTSWAQAETATATPEELADFTGMEPREVLNRMTGPHLPDLPELPDMPESPEAERPAEPSAEERLEESSHQEGLWPEDSRESQSVSVPPPAQWRTTPSEGWQAPAAGEWVAPSAVAAGGWLGLSGSAGIPGLDGSQDESVEHGRDD